MLLVNVELRPASDHAPGMSDVFELSSNERIDLLLIQPENLAYPQQSRTISINKQSSDIVLQPLHAGPAHVTLQAYVNGNLRYSKQLNIQTLL